MDISLFKAFLGLHHQNIILGAIGIAIGLVGFIVGHIWAGLWLSENRKSGFDEGFAQGRGAARDELKTDLLIFLKEQVRILENQLPAPSKDNG